MGKIGKYSLLALLGLCKNASALIGIEGVWINK
jgi:hypothetical protein